MVALTLPEMAWHFRYRNPRISIEEIAAREAIDQFQKLLATRRDPLHKRSRKPRRSRKTTIPLHPNQSGLATCLLAPLRHVARVCDLSTQESKEVICELEPALEKAFGVKLSTFHAYGIGRTEQTIPIHRLKMTVPIRTFTGTSCLDTKALW